ncbi:MAG: threonine/serine dehydratase [Acidobacteriota bacterium]
MTVLETVALEEIQKARRELAGAVVRTPLVRLNWETPGNEVFLKLENLQPIGSFKLRGAAFAMARAGSKALAKGVYTASAGNMAQGVAWNASRLGIPSTSVVPDHAPQTKLQSIRRLGGQIVKVPFDEWWQVILTHRYSGLDGLFIHPVCDPAVMAGNGTIGLEILEDLPEVDAIIIPYGGGGLSCGIASAVRRLKPQVRIYACEVETAAPLFASLAAGQPRSIDYIPSFVDGIGGKSVLEEMWPLVLELIQGSIVVSLRQTACAVRLLMERNRVVSEGAGAASVAAALSGGAGEGKIVCVVSGGNIDSDKLVKILEGEIP